MNDETKYDSVQRYARQMADEAELIVKAGEPDERAWTLVVHMRIEAGMIAEGRKPDSEILAHLAEVRNPASKILRERQALPETRTRVVKILGHAENVERCLGVVAKQPE